MAINKVIAKINAEAAAEVEAIQAEAKQKAAVAGDRVVAAATQKAKEIAAQAQSAADEAARRQVLIAELEARKSALKFQRDVLDEAFAQAGQALNELPAAKWEHFITALVLQGSETGCEQLCVPAADRPKYEGGFLAKLNTALQQAGKTGKLTLAPADGAFTGGVILIGTSSDFDASFPTLLKLARSQYEHDVADILFKTEVK